MAQIYSFVRWSGSAFLAIAVSSVTAACIIFGVLLFSKLFLKRYGAKWRYIIWLVFAVRLLLPVTIILPHIAVQIKTPRLYINMNTTVTTVDNMHIPQTIITSQPSNIPIDLYDILGVVWVGGMLIFGLYHMAGYILYRKQLRKHIQMAGDNYEKQFRSVCTDMRIKKQVRLFQSDTVNSPMLIGVFRPMIILPQLSVSEQELDMIFKHELIHLRRKDLFYKLFMLFVNMVHWFNPVIYFMRNQAEHDIEMLCDAEVVYNSSIREKQIYAQAMLTVVKHGVRKKAVLSTQFWGGRNFMKQRLEQLFATTIKRRGSMLLLIWICLLIFGSMFTGCTVRQSETVRLSEPELLYAARTPYIGNHIAVGKAIGALPFTDALQGTGMELQTSYEPYGLTVNYKIKYYDGVVINETVREEIARNSAAMLLCLIDNLGSVTFNIADTVQYTGAEYSYTFTPETIGTPDDIKSYAQSYEKFEMLYHALSETKTVQ